MRTHGAVVGRRFRSVTKLTTKVRIGRGYLWGSFLIAAAALKTPTRNDYSAPSTSISVKAEVQRTRIQRAQVNPLAKAEMQLGLYTISPPPILYGVWHTKGGSVGGRILHNGRAIVLQ